MRYVVDDMMTLLSMVDANTKNVLLDAIAYIEDLENQVRYGLDEIHDLRRQLDEKNYVDPPFLP